MRRWIKIAMLAMTFLLAVGVLDASAQKGRRRGGRGRRGGALFGAARSGRVGRYERNTITSEAELGPAPTAVRPTPGGGLAAEEARFRGILKEIDETIEKADRERAAALERAESLGFALPKGVEPGTVEWRALQKPIFETSDYDRSGWISFREAQESLEIDRVEFAQYDRDRDGRIGPREFMARYDEVVAQTGAYRLPKAKDSGAKFEPRSPEQLRNAFDTDGDGGLGRAEVETLLASYGKREVTSELLLEHLDQDRSAKIDGQELFQLSRLISVTFAVPSGDEIKRPKLRSVEQLFGQVAQRPSGSSDVHSPPWIPGPVSHFRRLDLDSDGFVTIDEMRDLQGAASLGTRLGAVVATLDLDEDGRISEREFLTSLSTARK